MCGGNGGMPNWDCAHDTTHDTTVVRARCRHKSSSPGTYLESELGGEHSERDAMGDGHVGRDVYRRHLWKVAACSGRDRAHT